MTKIRKTKRISSFISKKEWDKTQSRLLSTDLSPEKKLTDRLLKAIACYERNFAPRRIKAGRVRKNKK
jgi:hypothetical protein